MNAPPWSRFSGKPAEAVVASGIEMVVCTRALAWSCPFIELKKEPYSAGTRVPLSPAAATKAAFFFGVRAVRSEFPALCDPVEIGLNGALHSKRRSVTLVGSAVADHRIRAFLNRRVRMVGTPFDHGRIVTSSARCCRQCLFNEF